MLVMDPHCVPVTPVDYVHRIDFIPGDKVCITFAKLQSEVDGTIVGTVVARLEWSIEQWRTAHCKCHIAAAEMPNSLAH